MTTRPFNITPYLNGGLYAIPHSRFAIGLESAKGFWYDMERISPIVKGDYLDMNSSSISFGHPWPQVFRGQTYTLVCTEREIYLADTSTQPWTLTLLVTVQLGGGLWNMVDLGDAYYLTNDDTVVYLVQTHSRFGNANPVIQDTSLTMKTCIYHMGRVVCGGMSADDMWTGNALWAGNFTAWLAGNPESYTLTETSPRANWVVWSSIGGGDFPYWLMTGWEAAEHGLTQSMVEEKFRLNELGFAPMPFSGNILSMAKVDRSIIVGGANGIGMMQFTPGNGIMPSTYGITQLADFGIANRGAMVALGSTVFFITEAGELWRRTPEGGLNKLGFRDHIPSNPVLLVDEQEKALYITGSEQALVLRGDKLTEANFIPTSIWDTGWVGSLGDGLFEMSTTPFDMGVSGIKTIHTLRLSVAAAENVEVSFEALYTYKEKTHRQKWIPLSPEGNLTTMISGDAFRLHIRSANSTSLYISEGVVEWQLSDNRAVRSIYATAGDS